MKSYWIEPKEKIKTKMRMILGTLELEKLIQTRRQSLVDLIPLIWMRMRRRCCRNVELVWPILKEKKLKERLEKSNSKRLED